MKPTQLHPPFPAPISAALESFNNELRRFQEEVRAEIFRDPLTGLWNFMAFEALWKQSPPQSAHLLFIEVDEMKTLNNKFGHDDADRFLVSLGKILGEECDKDMSLQAFHISGDEFLMLANNLSTEQVATVATRLLRRVQESTVIVAGVAEHFTVSVGAAFVDPREAIESSKIARDLAENAVKQAKRDGRNCFRWLEDVHKDEPRLKHRKDCPACRTYFELEVTELEYRERTNFFCPSCGQAVAK